MMWYDILALCVLLLILVSFSVFLMVVCWKEQVKIDELRKWQIKFYKSIVEVYSNGNEQN